MEKYPAVFGKQELSDTSRLYLRCITCVPPVTALLFANLLSELKVENFDLAWGK